MPSDGEYAGHTDWPEVERDHAAVITYLDVYVGDLLALLKKLKIEENTLVRHSCCSLAGHPTWTELCLCCAVCRFSLHRTMVRTSKEATATTSSTLPVD